MAEQSSQVARELKWLDAKELDPASLNVMEQRGNSVNEELHMPSIRQPTPGAIHVHSAIQNSKLNYMCPHHPLTRVLQHQLALSHYNLAQIQTKMTL